MNTEQFESAMLNVSVKLILTQHDMNEVERRFDVDSNDGLVCRVTGENFRGVQKKFELREHGISNWKGKVL
jgi:hypothetical protein